MMHSYTVKSALSVALFGFLAMGLAPVASAATNTTTTFTVTAGVGNTCIISATNMAFTTIPTTTASNATSSISVGCTLNDPYTVGLSAGDSGVETARYMEGKNASNKLYYALSSSSSMSPNWGITNGAQSGTGAGTSSPTVFQVYGQITAAQAAAAAVDNYTDTITVTVTY